MLNFVRKLFSRNTNNICAAIDIGSFSVKTIIFDSKDYSKKVISYGEAMQNFSAMKNGMITDLKSVLNTVNESINIAENKIGKSVQKVVFGINADCDLFYQKSFRGYLQTIADEIGGKFLGFYSLPRVYACTINDKKNYIIVDIGASITSVVLVKDGLFKKSESFPIGASIFTKRVSKLFALSQEEANKIKIAYSIGKSIDYKIVNNDFQQDMDLWMTAFYVALKNFSEESLPNIILLTGGGSLFPLVKDALKSGNFPFKRLKFMDKPIVEYLGFEGLSIGRFKKEEQYVSWVPVSLLGKFFIDTSVM